MEILKITIDSVGQRFLNRFVYGQISIEPGAILSLDGINLPKVTQEESDRIDENIKKAAETGKAANSFSVYRQNLS
jgi:hypothetical protein